MEFKPRLTAKTTDKYGEFVLEPLQRGYGVTIGNPLRRILLSSIPGTAVTSVYIEDVLHEFSTINGVTEDVIHIILNLKQLVVKFHAGGPKTLSIRAEGPRQVFAKDLDVPSDAEIVNPDQYICTLGKGGKLVMEIRVEEGVGYVPSERHNTKDRINSIPVDAVYTPVTRVAYHVEDTRVGQQTDLDRLILRIWTDGSVSPDGALEQAVGLLREQLNVFSSAEKVTPPPAPMRQMLEVPKAVIPAENPPVREKLISKAVAQTGKDNGMTLEGLGLTTRTLHSLKEEGVDSVSALTSLSEKDLKKVPGVGERSMDEIKKQLAIHGLELKP
ncbi:MAG: DNA-directed RNA polymerase subunit alpha [Deinococcales bacterium]